MNRPHTLTRKVACETRKVTCEATGLEAAFYVHVDHDLSGRVHGIKISTPGKFENKGIERILKATEDQINDALQSILKATGAV